MFKRLIYILLAAVMVWASACQAPERANDTPSYVEVDSFSLKTISAQGVNSHNITDVWVFSNSIFVGVFPLPAKIPILASGDTRITLYAGTYSDGSRAYRIQYPFYTGLEDTLLKLIPGQSVKLNPLVTYVNDLETPLRFYEDFELGGIAFDSSIFSDFDIEASSEAKYLGPKTQNRVGLCLAPAGKEGVLDIVSKDFISFKGLSTTNRIYLEMDYSCSLPIAIGMDLYNDDNQYIGTLSDLVMNPTEGKWRKVYVFLTDEVKTYPTVTKGKLLISSSTDGKKEHYFAIDNVRWLNSK